MESHSKLSDQSGFACCPEIVLHSVKFGEQSDRYQDKQKEKVHERKFRCVLKLECKKAGFCVIYIKG